MGVNVNNITSFEDNPNFDSMVVLSLACCICPLRVILPKAWFLHK